MLPPWQLKSSMYEYSKSSWYQPCTLTSSLLNAIGFFAISQIVVCTGFATSADLTSESDFASCPLAAPARLCICASCLPAFATGFCSDAQTQIQASSPTTTAFTESNFMSPPGL